MSNTVFVSYKNVVVSYIDFFSFQATYSNKNGGVTQVVLYECYTLKFSKED